MTTNNATYPPSQPTVKTSTVKTSTVKTVPGNITIPPPRRNADAPITHAWSIGTTRLVKPPQQPAPKEECPPEVYIG